MAWARSKGKRAVPTTTQTMHHGEKHDGRNAEQKHPIRCLQVAQQPSRRRHEHIAVAQRHIVDPRMAVGGFTIGECPAHYEQDCPRGYLIQVRHERQSSGSPFDCDIEPKTIAHAAAPLLKPNEVYDSDDVHNVDQNGAHYRTDVDR